VVCGAESAIFGQPEAGLGLIPGAGGVQHLARLLGRARALEVMLSADDYEAELAERYGWINRALPATALDDFVRSLAHRIAGLPAGGRVMVKERVNALALAPPDDFRRDSDLFGQGVRDPEAQKRIRLYSVSSCCAPVSPCLQQVPCSHSCQASPGQ
jgi:enoyl-CoA hydratase/carnithine racemase